MAEIESEDSALSPIAKQQDTKLEVETTASLPSPRPKRKQSPEPDHDTSHKKRRLSASAASTEAEESVDLVEHAQSNGHTVTSSLRAGRSSKSTSPITKAGPETSIPPAPSSPARDSSSAKPQIDERKRGRRLFGAVFGALGQTTPNQLAKRREIERKQREKLREQAEEDDAARQGRLAKLQKSRLLEQRRFDSQSMRVRQSNALAMAHSLFTSAEPRIYWKPWESTAAEEDRIRRQVREAEAMIEAETEDAGREEGAERQQDDQEPIAERGKRSPDRAGNEREAGDADVAMTSAERVTEKSWNGQNIMEGQEKFRSPAAGALEADRRTKSPLIDEHEASLRKDDIDEGAEDNDGEDTVIY